MLSSSHQRNHRAPLYYAPPTAITTSAAAPAYYSYNYNSSPLYYPVSSPSYTSKRIKVEHDDWDLRTPTTNDCPQLLYHTMPQAVPASRLAAPHINLQRASEPASPVTIASSVSNHSTPSPSPSSVTIVSETTPHHEYGSFDDGFNLPENQQKQHRPSNIFTGIFSNVDPGWAHYLPQSVDFSKLSRQQQQYLQQHHPDYHHSSDDEVPPALSPSHVTHASSASSRPSVSENDMPDTPVHSPTQDRHCGDPQLAATQHSSNVPKLARTVSDAVQDELFNPGIAPGTTHSQVDRLKEPTTPSQLPALFQQAQSQHAMAHGTPTQLYIREHSPFRANSPFHPARTQQETTQAPTRTSAFLNVAGFQSERTRREKEKEREAEALRSQIQKDMESMQEPPNTISPKEAYIEYHEPEGEGIQGSLFASSQPQEDSLSQASTTNCDAVSGTGSYSGSVHEEDDEESQDEQGYESMATSRRESVSQIDYPMSDFHANGTQQPYGQNMAVPHYWPADQDHSSSPQVSDESGASRPDDTRANDAAYTCTVQGCTQRFPTTSKMSKHRREVHRHGTPMIRGAPTKSLLQGPSRCVRINPTTGKPCNTVFSRPYDLTRHEDTIHNTNKNKVRCDLCKDKTFSRQDALTRHKKVKHGIDK